MRFPRVLFLFLSFFPPAAGVSAAQDIDSTNQTARIKQHKRPPHSGQQFPD